MPRPARVFRFDKIREAHRVMEANGARGKMVVVHTDPHPFAVEETHMPRSVAIVMGASQGIGRATGHPACARHLGACSGFAQPRQSAANGSDGQGGRRRCGSSMPTWPNRAPQTVVGQALNAFGRIDALLNIAGAVPEIGLFELSDAQGEGGLALKLYGVRRITIAAWPALKAARGRWC